MLKYEDQFYIHCTPQGRLLYRDSAKNFVQDCTSNYNLSKIGHGLIGKTSATNHYEIAFKPRLVSMPLEDIATKLFESPTEKQVKNLNAGIANTFAMHCDSKNNLQEIYDNGISLDLKEY
jgi:hypothetical protein